MQIFLFILLGFGFTGANVLRWQFSNGYAISLLDIALILTTIYVVISQNKLIILNKIFKPLFFLFLALTFSLILKSS
jgi:hypothetical protein